MKNKKRYIRKLRLYSLLVIAIIISVILIILIIESKQERKAQEKDLQTLVEEKAKQVKMYLDIQILKHKILSENTEFREAFLYPEDKTKIDAADKIIDKLRETVPGISLLTPEGIVITADIDLPGTDYRSMPYFMAEKKKLTFDIYYDPLRKNDFIVVGGPVFHEGKIIGALGFDLALDELNYIMGISFNEPDIESYIINKDGLLLTSSKYIGQENRHGILLQRVDSEGAKECIEDLREHIILSDMSDNIEIEEHEEEALIYENYMGEKVLGTHAYAPSIVGCILAEKKID